MGWRSLYLKGVATLGLDKEACIGCGMCLAVCPREVFVMEQNRAVINELDACMECGACMSNCPAAAIRVQSGVGCAQAVFNTLLGRSGEACCQLDEKETTCC